MLVGRRERARRWIVKLSIASFLLAKVVTSGCSAAPPAPAIDLESDTWVGTDALGRSLSLAPRTPRANRFVGMFYFLTHGTSAHHDAAAPGFDAADVINDNTEILGRLIGALGPSNPLYLRAYRPDGVYWWGEPAVGYFLSDDVWVHRKNLMMLADAGVDVLLLDATNAVLYDDAEKALFEAAIDLQRLGCPVPKFAYVTYSGVAETVPRIYQRFYTGSRYRSLWFTWLGKPLILGDADAVTAIGKTPIPAPIREFFTWRRSWAWTPRPARPAGKGGWFGDGHDRWPWIDDFPQNFGWHDNQSAPEEVPVAVAGHPIDDLGRSFRGTFNQGGGEPPLGSTLLSPATQRGPYFAQQWRRAIQLDPQFIFVTGWNEWYATKFVQKPPFPVPNFGKHLPFFFVDEFNEEFSRDVMPMKGGHQDDYYFQLVEGIRRFKGARRPPLAHVLRTINIAAGFEQWEKVSPEYLHGAGDVAGRDWPGWGKNNYHVPAKRNVIVLAKVACDPSSIAFYVRTASPLTPDSDPSWMYLLIDTHKKAAGWHGYDLLLNRQVAANGNTRGTTSIDRWTDGAWKKVGEASIRCQGNELMIVASRSLMNLPAGSGAQFDFHWLDDVPLSTDPAEFWYGGESAPDGRFNYRYSNTADGAPLASFSKEGVTPLSIDERAGDSGIPREGL